LLFVVVPIPDPHACCWQNEVEKIQRETGHREVP
jgi:hypothetical protein